MKKRPRKDRQTVITFFTWTTKILENASTGLGNDFKVPFIFKDFLELHALCMDAVSSLPKISTFLEHHTTVTLEKLQPVQVKELLKLGCSVDVKKGRAFIIFVALLSSFLIGNAKAEFDDAMVCFVEKF